MAAVLVDKDCAGAALAWDFASGELPGLEFRLRVVLVAGYVGNED
jgi:hypothetical protein